MLLLVNKRIEFIKRKEPKFTLQTNEIFTDHDTDGIPNSFLKSHHVTILIFN